jgi:hypothetical protein
MSNGSTSLINKGGNGLNAMNLVENGEPRATIVLPVETEFDKYANISPAEMDAFLKKRLPNATNSELAIAKKALLASRKRNMKRVGDEEELALAELLEFIKKISGAALPVKRIWESK